MDPGVLEAMRRWPNVPAVHGWLSLTPRGEWRLHPLGDASLGGYGEGISNEQILSFINRNYLSDESGCWFFQNGPQRVFVRLDAAPLIMRVNQHAGQLDTHCGQVIQEVSHWWIDEIGRLFAQTDVGPAMVDDRDLMTIGEVLQSVEGQTQGLTLMALLEALDADCGAGAADQGGRSPTMHQPLASAIADPSGVFSALRFSAPLDRIDAQQVPACLGFIANPVAPSPDSAVQALE